MNAIVQFFKRLFSKEPAMTDPVQAVEPSQVADPAPVAVQAAPVTVAPTISTDKLRDILKLFGHDVDTIWDDAVSLAKKAL